jgi:hypothetical protein
MSQLVIVTKHFSRYQIVIRRFLAVTFRDITLYVVNNHLIARTIIKILVYLIYLRY